MCSVFVHHWAILVHEAADGCGVCTRGSQGLGDTGPWLRREGSSALFIPECPNSTPSKSCVLAKQVVWPYLGTCRLIVISLAQFSKVLQPRVVALPCAKQFPMAPFATQIVSFLYVGLPCSAVPILCLNHTFAVGARVES